MDRLARNANIESAVLVVLNTVLSVTSVVTSFGRIRLSFGLKMFVMAVRRSTLPRRCVAHVNTAPNVLQDNVVKKMESLSLCVQFWCMCSVLTKCLRCLNASLDGPRVRKTRGNEKKRNEIDSTVCVSGDRSGTKRAGGTRAFLS